MTYSDLCKTALGMVSEDIENGDTADYEERAGYLLATFCRECAAADEKYRTAHAIGTTTVPTVACVDLSEDFPLSDVFAPAASYYLAAMLVLDENEEMSETLFERYTDLIVSIQAALPASNAPIADRYSELKI